ncbi:MAG TPA: PspC domain-containing protein [Verrucomicrobiae bacterium]|nr:PspC domain-containing protein [Verrucomicrobiae bacterium]
MNEVTHIHLSRQQFTISVDAHHELKTYLADIQKKVGDKEIVNEIESRMSELLIERGVTDEKVALPEDIDYLKEQLGTPEDFSEEEPVEESKKAQEAGSKRLFRDPDNALVAGVAAGVANYFGLDVVLVRLAIVVLTIFSFGTGIVLYILSWLLIPPATTASEKLQMRGKPVTLEAIKDSVSKTEVTNTARQINSSLLAVIDTIFRICVKLIGIGTVLFGLALLTATAVTRIYMSLHNGRLFQENLFPVGSREDLLVWIGMGLAILISIFLILAGIAIFRRKWPLNGWITGALAAIFLAGSVVTIALAADAAPHVNERYQALMHTTGVKNVKPFDKVATKGNIDISYISSPTYAANVHYADHPDLSKLKIYVTNNTLYIDSTQLDKVNHCTMLCLYPRYNMTVEIYAPNVQNFDKPLRTDIFYPKVPAPPSMQ